MVIVWYGNGACTVEGSEQQDYTCPFLCVTKECEKEADFDGPSVCMF